MIEVRRAADAAERDAALALRHEVFVVEQGVTVAEEYDGRDDEALHLVAVEDGVVVGTCRLVPAGTTVKLGRMAVAKHVRRRGLASRLLALADDEARAQEASRIALHAQTDALALYGAAGYAARGARFMEAGIEHVAMEKRLS
jgi:predicted GNAT family N-acyltransferase